jgi:zinc transport system substrate-binding protein
MLGPNPKLLLSCIILFISATNTSAADKVSVFVTIAPQRYFVQKIGKNLVDVSVMVPTGADPHIFEPKPQQMIAMARAKLYFAIGIDFEKARLDKIISTSPQIQVVHTDQGIQKIPMSNSGRNDAHHLETGQNEERENLLNLTHGNDVEHQGSDRLDPHIWLSPPLVMIQARTILNALQEVDPTHRSDYEANFNAFISELMALDVELKAIFAGKRELRFLVFHPSWGYFARSYGLVQVPIEIGGKNPKLSQLKELIEHARGNNVKVVFVQPQFSSKSAKLIAKEIGAEVAFADPLAENWSANLREVAGKVAAALK